VGRARDVGQRRLDRRAELVVPVDDEEGQQLVAALHVPVDRRRHHAEVPGNRAERERGSAVPGQVLPSDPGDVVHRLRASAFPGSACHAPILPQL
jgi:hypothetical protein